MLKERLDYLSTFSMENYITQLLSYEEITKEYTERSNVSENRRERNSNILPPYQSKGKKNNPKSWQKWSESTFSELWK